MPDLTDKIMANIESRLTRVEERPEPNFVVICDGGSLDNQVAKLGYGSYMIEIPGRQFRSAIKKVDYGPGVSNNEAEYMIAIDALKVLEDIILAEGGLCNQYVIEIKTDSQLVIGHMSKGWKLNAKNLEAHYNGLKHQMEKFKAVIFAKMPDTWIKEVLGH